MNCLEGCSSGRRPGNTLSHFIPRVVDERADRSHGHTLRRERPQHGWSFSLSSLAGSSQASYWDGSRMMGIRSWSVACNSFGSPVMSEHDSRPGPSVSPGARHHSHNPAILALGGALIRHGTLHCSGHPKVSLVDVR
jgi:hypothetical protein